MNDAITDLVVRESGRYVDGEIYDRAFPGSPWLTLMPRGPWPGARGDILNILTYERSAPTSLAKFKSISVTDGGTIEGGTCLPEVDHVSVGSTTRTMQLYHQAFEGPRFCATDLRSVFELETQLGKVAGVLSDYVRLWWEMLDRREYFYGCKHKVVVDSATSETSTSTQATTYPAAQATSELPMGLLQKWRMKLIRDGAAGSAMGRISGAPVLTCITSAETADNLIREDANARQDLRDGNPSPLLAGLGALTAYRDIVFIYDPFPRRFTYAGGAYTEVQPFVASAATKGQKYEVNSAWEAADYEEAFFFDPMVMRQLVPAPVVNPHPQFRFDPVRYTGEWAVKNILDTQDNPDGTILYHRGVCSAASMPVHPERGVAFIHKRCDPKVTLRTVCSA